MYKVTPGLNLINLHSWNKTVIAKLCWDLEHKQDKLWIKWVHSYFSRSYHFPTSLLDGKENFGGYSLAGQKYDQATILSRVSAPTESSMEVLDVSKLCQAKGSRLQLQNRLSTTDRLRKWGLDIELKCVLCQLHIESRDHMYTSCPYRQQIWSKLLQ
ncbi:hypothetical protein MTR67_042236 [Solanum verrucosum]|uniref:Reverse transcriptase zinc-binding domain-containing protein n=2 Tax=Solanum TaxID=4107 RepID=A0AAF0UPK3_SOLVR|nr:hypothetical protein MTR67_042236 [Solanum verrucosum]